MVSFIKTVLSNLYKNTLDDSAAITKGRGLTPEKAFKTINACIMYVCNNYNLGIYNLYINISGHDYSDSNDWGIALRFYNANGGMIIIQGAGVDKTIIGKVATSGYANSIYELRRLTINGNSRYSTYGRRVYIADGFRVWLRNIVICVTENRAVGEYGEIPLEVANGGSVWVVAADNEVDGSGIVFRVSEKCTKCTVLINVRVNGVFNYTADLCVDGTINLGSGAFAYVQ